MASNKKYLSLEEAAFQLGLKPDELVRLREKGEVRGFADRGTWKFKADDIEEYHRSRQPDSEPDLPIFTDFDGDGETGDNDPVNQSGIGMKSDSDVRLVPSEVPKKRQLSGSSAEVTALDQHRSDSDVQLVEDPKVTRLKASKKGSDSDVKIVKPNVDPEADSDSDVKMATKPLRATDSDSDVKLLEPLVSVPDSDSDVRMADSDSDVRMAESDSDVRLAPIPDSDSDVKVIREPAPSASHSDSDVKLLTKKPRNHFDDDGPLAPLDFEIENAATEASISVKPDSSIRIAGDSSTKRKKGSGITLPADSAISLAGDSGTKNKRDSGISLPRDSGISLPVESGIQLSRGSGIHLSEESGVRLIQPADSGISLEGMDSEVRFADSGISLGADSGISLGADSGIRLGGSSGKNVKGDPKKKRKGDSNRNLKGASPTEFDDIESTTPMLLPDFDQDDDSSGEFSASDTSEMQSFSASGQNVVLFEDEDDEADTATIPKRKSKKSPVDSVFNDEAEPQEELEVADEDLIDDDEYGGLDFDSQDDSLGEDFSEGENQPEFVAPNRIEVAREVEWSATDCGLLFVSASILIVGSIVSADLLQVIWATGADSAVNHGLAGLLAGPWK